MITVQFAPTTTASVEGGTWTSDDPDLTRILPTDYEGYAPYPDLALAELAVERLGGKIVHVDPQPEDPDPDEGSLGHMRIY